MKLTIGEAREFVRARLDELAAQASDMLLDAIDDRNLDNTIDKLLEDAVTYIHLAAPASLMEGPILTEGNFLPGDLSVTNRVLEIDTALSDIEDDILRMISFQCGDSDIKLTEAFYEDSPEARMQLNQYIQGQPDSPALVRLDDSPNFKPHYKYYTTDMCLDGVGQALRFVLRYFAKPKIKGGSLSINPSAITLASGMNSKTVTISSTSAWRLTTQLPDWVYLSETSGVGTATITVYAQQNRGGQRSRLLTFENDEGTATLEVTQRAYSNSEGNEQLKVASTAMINGVISLPSTQVGNVIYLHVAAVEGLAWTARLSDTENFYLGQNEGIGKGIDNWTYIPVQAKNPNDTGTARTATITFSAAGVNPIIVTLRQPTKLTVLPVGGSASVPAPAGSLQFAVTTEGDWTAALENVPEGTYLDNYSGNGNGYFTVYYPKNDTGALRLMRIVVSSGGAYVNINIAQAAAEAQSISVNPSLLGPFPASGDLTGQVVTANVTATSEWTLDTSSIPAWLNIRRSPLQPTQLLITEVSPNTSSVAREPASIRVYIDASHEAFLTVTQLGQQGSISLVDSAVPVDSVTVPHTGGTYNASLTASGAWTLTTDKTWVHITSGTSGTGNATVTFSVDSGTAADTAKITASLNGTDIVSEYYIIREQAPAQTDYVELVRYPNNWFWDNDELPASATNSAITVNASGAWRAVAVDSWITPMTQYAEWSGTGNSTLYYEVERNSGARRTGRVVATCLSTGATSTFYVYQNGSSGVSLSASFNKSSIDSSAQQLELSVQASSGLTWTIDNVSSGLTPASYSGTGSASIRVDVSSTNAQRTLSLRVRNVAYGIEATPSCVQQEPAPVTSYLTITPYNLKTVNQNTTSVEITVRSNVSWSASVRTTGGSAQATVTPQSGTNNGTVTVYFEANNDSTAREYEVTVSGGGITRTLRILQQPATHEALVVSPMSADFSGAGGTQTISVDADSSWSLSKSDSWITTSVIPGRTSQATGFTITVGANTGGPRTGTVTVTSGSVSKIIAVSQGTAANLVVSGNSVILAKAANSSESITVYASDAWMVDEDTSNIPAWLNYSYNSSHDGSTSGEGLTFTAIAENTSGAPLTALVYLKLVNVPDADPVAITITQSPGSDLTISPTNVSAHARNTSGTITVRSNTDWRVIQVSDRIFIDADNTSGTGNGTIEWELTGNPFDTEQRLTITLQTTDGAVSRILTITQAAGGLSLSSDSITLAGSGESKSVTLFSSANWEVQSKPSWITIRPTSGMANTPDGEGVTIDAEANPSTIQQRTGQVVFRQTTFDNTVTLNITQSPASSQTLELTPTEVWLNNGDATTQQLEITSSTNWELNLSETFGITADTLSGTGNATVTLTIPINQGNLRRHVVKVVGDNGKLVRTLSVWQPVSSDDVVVSPTSVIFDEDSSTAQVTVSANRPWTAVSSGTWLRMDRSSGAAGTTVVTLTARIDLRNFQRATWTVTTQGGATATVNCKSLPSDGFKPVLDDDPKLNP